MNTTTAIQNPPAAALPSTGYSATVTEKRAAVRSKLNATLSLWTAPSDPETAAQQLIWLIEPLIETPLDRLDAILAELRETYGGRDWPKPYHMKKAVQAVMSRGPREEIEGQSLDRSPARREFENWYWQKYAIQPARDHGVPGWWLRKHGYV